MINKYHLVLLLVLTVSTVSISITSKNKETQHATTNKPTSDPLLKV